MNKGNEKQQGFMPSSVDEGVNADRRRLIKQTSIIGAGALLGAFSPAVFAAPSKEVIVRGIGGSYQEALEKAVYKPFTELTGINVIIQPSTAAQIMAMIKAGRVTLDVLDIGDVTQTNLNAAGALMPINYAGMKFTNPDDIFPEVRRPNMVGNLFFSTVMVYNTDVFRDGNHPRTWAEFWDAERFPGPRTLTDLRTSSTELEFALLADGVDMKDIYPIDIKRAFASLSRIKPHVVKWWDTGALSVQLMERKEAVLGALWNGRAQALIDQGAPLAIEWNQIKQQLQYWSVLKGSPNPENAQLLIDFALQPEVQAKITQFIAYGPTNKKAFQFVRPEDLVKLPSNPEYYSRSFVQNAQWWTDNIEEVGKIWQPWILGQG